MQVAPKMQNPPTISLGKGAWKSAEVIQLGVQSQPNNLGPIQPREPSRQKSIIQSEMSFEHACKLFSQLKSDHEASLRMDPKIHTWKWAATAGLLHCIEYFHRNNVIGCNKQIMNYAAESGRFEVVKWLHENRMEGCTTQAMDMAAENGHFQIVRFLAHNRKEGCTSQACAQAALNGHFEIVRFLCERQYQVTVAALRNALQGGHFMIYQYLKMRFPLLKQELKEGFKNGADVDLWLKLKLQGWKSMFAPKDKLRLRQTQTI